MILGRFQSLLVPLGSRPYIGVFGDRFRNIRKNSFDPSDMVPRNVTGKQDQGPKTKEAFMSRRRNQPSVVPSTPVGTTANDDTINVQQLMTHFSKILTKHGRRGEDILAGVSATLRHRYQHPSPIALAIDAVKPVLKYQKFKNARSFVPVVLHPKPSVGIAVRWLVELAGKRTYIGGRPSIERGLVDEIEAILQGTSSLYARRQQFHKNPN